VRQVTLQIDGMSCHHCLNAVSQALNALPGVKVGAIRIGGAEVSYDETTTGPAQLEAVVTEAGYRAKVQR